MKECNLNQKGFCTCYQRRCNKINDCALKLINKRNMNTVNKLIENEKV